MSTGNKTKSNKKKFASLSKELKGLKRKDPKEFDRTYNAWKGIQKKFRKTIKLLHESI